MAKLDPRARKTRPAERMMLLLGAGAAMLVMQTCASSTKSGPEKPPSTSTPQPTTAPTPRVPPPT